MLRECDEVIISWIERTFQAAAGARHTKRVERNTPLRGWYELLLCSVRKSPGKVEETCDAACLRPGAASWVEEAIPAEALAL
jgi:hypothetical protein